MATATATVPTKLLLTASLLIMLLLGLAIGYVVSDPPGSQMPMQMMTGVDMRHMFEHMDDMSAHMDEMGMNGTMMDAGTKGSVVNMPPMHGHD